MKRFLTLLLPLICLMAFTPGAGAQSPFIDDRTIGVIRINMDGVDFAAISKILGRVMPGRSEDFPPPELVSLVDLLKKNGVEQLNYHLSLDELPQSIFAVAKVAQGIDIDELVKKFPKDKFNPLIWKVVNKQLVLGTEQTLNRLASHKSVNRPDLTKAIDSLPAGGAIQLAFSLPADARKLAEETLPRIPDNIGGGSVKVLTRGLQFASFSLELKPEVVLKGTFQASDPEAARELQALWNKSLKMVATLPEVANLMPKLSENIAKLTPEIEEDRLKLRFEPGNMMEVVAKPIQDARIAAMRAVSMNNLKQMGLAFHNYHDTYNAFPAAASTGKDGKKLLSWRVAILPFVDQADLYKEFHLNEPWDSEHNKKLLPRMPKIYQSPVKPDLAKAFKTCYVLPVGKDTMHPGDKGLKIAKILDGTSNTIMVLESSPEAAVEWTRPDDINVDPKDPYKGLGMEYGKGFLAGFADGSVRFLGNRISPKDLYSYFTCAGGEVIGPEPREEAPEPRKPEPKPLFPQNARTMTMNNFKQLALAFHLYASDNKSTFPAAAITSKEGKKLLSWRVAILPFIDQGKLYKEFHLDEPWDSEHNKKLIPRMPKIFAPLSKPELAKEFKTCYLLPVGKETVNPGIEGLKFQDIKDGLSNTILMVEVAPEAAVEWTKPQDIEIDPKEPFKNLSTFYGDGIVTVFCDGSVRFLSSKVKPKWLWAIFTRNGGEAIPVNMEK